MKSNTEIQLASILRPDSTASALKAMPTPIGGDVRVGPYRLCLDIATGGMASVYLARAEHRTGIHRFVALKRIHPHLAHDSTFVEMFLDEARVASLVQHANVCSVIDFDASEDGYYLVMEYLMGEPLSAVYRMMLHKRTEKPIQRAALVARVIADACEGLHAAHEACDPSGEPLGVVHRDVSPENLFLTYDGVVKVCDFGVARATRQKHKTRSGVLKGKYAYMAPEVLRGKKANRRADIWSLGVVAWELLVQKRLFSRGTDLQTLQSLADARVVPPSKARPGLPRDYDEIVLHALARNPDERYATAREFGRDLLRVLAQRRQVVGLADLSEWMEELFPGGRACKRQLVEIAARLDELTVVRHGATELVEDGPTRVIDSDRTLVRDPHATPVRTPTSRRPDSMPPTAVDAPPPPRRSWRRTAVFSSAAALAVAALGVSVLRRPPSPPVSNEVAAAPVARVAIAAARPAETEPPPKAAPPPTSEPDHRPAAAATAPAAIATPYFVEVEQPRGSESRDIVIRIRPEAQPSKKPKSDASPKSDAPPPIAEPPKSEAPRAARASFEPTSFRPHVP